MISNYYYDEQIRKWSLQFANIFTNMVVKTGKGSAGEIDTVPVPIHYGSRDRIISGISSGFTQNKMVFCVNPDDGLLYDCYRIGTGTPPWYWSSSQNYRS